MSENPAKRKVKVKAVNIINHKTVKASPCAAIEEGRIKIISIEEERIKSFLQRIK